MKYREFGRTGWSVSVVGMGCWGIGGGLGPVPGQQAIATVRAAFDAGVNLFDTADAYGPRVSEELVGRALEGIRDQAYISTKVGSIGWNTGHPFSYESPEHIYTCCDASLHRLRTDYIDFYQCHLGDPAHPEVFVEAFERLVEEGKIRAYGVSTDDPAVVRAFDARGRCSVCQLGYSVLSRNAEKELLPLCAERRIGTMVRVPLERGILTGKFTPDTVFQDLNRVAWNEAADRERFLAQLEAAERLRPLTGPDRSMTQVALAYAVAHPALCCAIPGMKTPEQARHNAAAGDVELTAAELEQIEAIPETSGPGLAASGRPLR